MPGSGVYIKRATYNQLQFIDKGSKLVRKLVREIFPDVHLLASSSCMGKGESSAGLDRHKVEVIKGGSHISSTLIAGRFPHTAWLRGILCHNVAVERTNREEKGKCCN